MYASALLGAGVDLVGSLLKHLDPAPGNVHLGSVDGETCSDGCGQSCFGVAGMSMHTFAETSPSTRDQDGLGSVLNQQEAPISQLTLPWTEKMSSSLKVGCSSAIVMEEVWGGEGSGLKCAYGLLLSCLVSEDGLVLEHLPERQHADPNDSTSSRPG